MRICSEILLFKIPFPSIDQQMKIVQNLNKKKILIDELKDKINNVDDEIEEDISNLWNN